MPTLAVGAAFAYLADVTSEPPSWMQRWGLQWLYRLAQDPKRLWRRYLILNPRFCAGVVRQRVSSSSMTPRDRQPQEPGPPFVGWA